MLALGTGILASGCGQPVFKDMALDKNPEKLSILQDRTAFPTGSSTQQELMGIVGLVVMDDRVPGATATPPASRGEFNPSESIGKYRPMVDELVVDVENRILYEGKVTRNLSAGGNYLVFTASLADNQAAEVLVKDEVYVSYKEPTRIPYKELTELARKVPGDKVYMFVEAARLTSIVRKTFTESKSEVGLAGTAFGANGKIYVSDQDYRFDAIVSVRAWNIARLLDAPGAISSATPPALRERVHALLASERLSPAEARELSDTLVAASRHEVQATLDRRASRARPATAGGP
jgi:hypothetical protein